MGRRRHKPTVVFLIGTFTEFIGNRDQPKALYERPVVFILGPAGSGKTTVAKHLVEPGSQLFRKDVVFSFLLKRILSRSWEQTPLLCPDPIIFEIPSVLGNKPQITKLLTELIQMRLALGYRSIVLDSEDNASLQGLMSSIDSVERVSIVLRLPEGKGRYRFLAHYCRERNIPLRYARKFAKVYPWTYRDVLSQLENIEHTHRREALLRS